MYKQEELEGSFYSNTLQCLTCWIWTDRTSCTHQFPCCYFQSPVGSCEMKESRAFPPSTWYYHGEQSGDSGGGSIFQSSFLLSPGLRTWRNTSTTKGGKLAVLKLCGAWCERWSPEGFNTSIPLPRLLGCAGLAFPWGCAIAESWWYFFFFFS